MNIKKFIFTIILILFFSNISNADISDADILKKIQFCADTIRTIEADKKRKNDQLNYPTKSDNYNYYLELLKKHSTNSRMHREIIEIVEEELKYLSEINFIKLQGDYLKFSSNLPFIETLFLSYYDDVRWADDEENIIKLNKRIRSDYFKDFSITKRSLEEKLKKHKAWEVQEIEETNKLKEMGEKNYNSKIYKTIESQNETSDRKNIIFLEKLRKFLEQDLKTKLQDKDYEKNFIGCEYSRNGAPITFDNKWS